MPVSKYYGRLGEPSLLPILKAVVGCFEFMIHNLNGSAVPRSLAARQRRPTGRSYAADGPRLVSGAGL